MQKKNIQIFSNCKNKHAKKKHEIIFQKKMQKKGRNAKKRMQKKAGGVYKVTTKNYSFSKLLFC